MGNLTGRGQGDGLPVIVEHIFNFNRRRSDVQDLIAPVHDVAFPCDENIVAWRDKNFLGRARVGGKQKRFRGDLLWILEACWDKG